MKETSKIVVLIVTALALTLGASLSFAQAKMTMAEYNKQMAEWQARLEAAEKGKVECAAKNESLKKQIGELQAQTDQVWKEILALIGVDQAAVDAFRAELKALDAKCDGLLALSPEELFKKRADVNEIEAKLAELKKNRIAVLSEMQKLIAQIEGKLAQIKSKMPKAIYDTYTVVVGDYLWKISGKKDIYNDPMQWMRIYSYNRDQIKNPDLIYPNWVLKIQRECGPDEYLVAKGDYLQKIAANPQVLGDPTSWTKIYEKNKDIIGDDPNLIFPHTVLIIPKN
ncbi:MAG: LysM peptidoglycan-binding domain-containing protein [candidate division KSB1 bacterium]|nr:LysM peptidoglycan-binding domain-containing protein [candidate division KSB1 bacterium]